MYNSESTKSEPLGDTWESIVDVIGPKTRFGLHFRPLGENEYDVVDRTPDHVQAGKVIYAVYEGQRKLFGTLTKEGAAAVNLAREQIRLKEKLTVADRQIRMKSMSTRRADQFMRKLDQ